MNLDEYTDYQGARHHVVRRSRSYPGEGELGTKDGGRGSRNKAGTFFRISRSLSWYSVLMQIRELGQF